MFNGNILHWPVAPSQGPPQVPCQTVLPISGRQHRVPRRCAQAAVAAASSGSERSERSSRSSRSSISTGVKPTSVTEASAPAPNALASASTRSTETTAAGSRTAVEPGSQAAGSAFTWTRHWWPLVPEAYLLTDRPNAITLLGIPLVVWLDKTTGTTTTAGGTWRVFRDRCPHRLAPLSEGRMEADGSLSCSYHGWRFDGSGACRRIPQAVDAAAEAAACASRRSCVTSFPARLEAGMLWAWLDESPDTAEEAAATPLLMSNDIRDRERRYHDHVSRTAAGDKPAGPAPYPVVWFMRDLPYSYEVLMENLTDPAHLPHSHHGVAPTLNRYKDAAMPMKRAQPTTLDGAADAAGTSTTAAPALPYHWARPSGPDIEYDFLGLMTPDATISITMPHHVLYTYRSALSNLTTELFAVPVAPGRSRFFTIMATRGPMPLPPLTTLLADPRKAIFPLTSRVFPELFAHFAMNSILDGDSVFLAAQDELLQEVEMQATADAAEGAESDKARPAAAATSALEVSGVRAADAAAAVHAEGGDAGFWSRLYYLPAQADGAVLAVRKWLEERAGGGPFRVRQRRLLAGPRTAAAAAEIPLGRALVSTVPGEAPSPQERERRLNRYDQHTRHCPYCRPMLQQLQRLVAVGRALQTAAVIGMCAAGGALGAAAASAAVSASAAAGVTAAAAAVPWAAPAALLAALAAVWALAGGLSAVAERLSSVFQFQDYVHAERN